MELKQIVFIPVFLMAVGGFAWTVSRLVQYFRLTKPEHRLDKIPERVWDTLYLGIGQVKILRFSVAGALHATIFWGFMVITFGTGEMAIDGIFGTERIFSFLGPIYDGLMIFGDVFAGLIIVAAVIFLGRRYITRPRRFTAPEMKPSSRQDATRVLVLTMLLMISLLAMNVGYLLEKGTAAEGIYPISSALSGLFSDMGADSIHLLHEAGWWVHILLVLLFLNFLPYSKHFHVMLSLPNVFFRNLENPGGLKNNAAITREVRTMLDPNSDPYASPAEGELAEAIGRFGVKDLQDLSWKTLMDAYTCTECGRCTSVCPANTTGKKLSPRKLFIDVRQRMKNIGPELVKNPEYSDGKSLFDFITPEEIWGCTTCGACIQECPVEISHVPLIVEMRQYLVMEESKAPAALSMMLSNIQNNGAPWAMSASSRFDWANDLDMPAHLVAKA
jgi:heterodisulfide reductase subunit C/nitrate reductase gamma subunit